MSIKFGKQFSEMQTRVENVIGSDKALEKALAGCDLSVGLSSEPEFGVPAHAAGSALFMGDSAHLGETKTSAAVEAMLKSNADGVQVKPKYNHLTNKFDMQFALNGDADFDPLAGQLFSPWNIAYLSKVWKRPLSYSRAHEMVRKETAGNNPFAEIFTLALEDYAGWGVIGQTGEYQNNMTNDVNVMNGLLSAPIINMMGTYSITLEEKQRKTWGMAQDSPIARKQQYLNYVMDLMDCDLIYNGNPATGTKGLLSINPIEAWDTGKSMKDLFLSNTTTTRGSDAYRIIAAKINDFLTNADNKFSKIKVAMSPEAYNYLTSMPYSDTYDATTAMQTFAKAYLAGKGPNGSTPMIEFVADPMLKANSIFNPNPFDYLIITAPEVGAGPGNETQATNFYAVCLDKFVFPVIPGMYNEQYKTLRRVAGIIAPIPEAVKVYSGFGRQE